MFIDLIQDVKENIKYSPVFSSHVKSTLFRYQYLLVVMDEAHSARKFNKIHMAYHGLRQQSQAIIAMTATPVMTKLQVRSITISFLYLSTYLLLTYLLRRIYG